MYRRKNKTLRCSQAFLTGVRNLLGAPPEEEIDEAFLDQYINNENMLQKPAETCIAGEHPFGRLVRPPFVQTRVTSYNTT